MRKHTALRLLDEERARTAELQQLLRERQQETATERAAKEIAARHVDSLARAWLREVFRSRRLQMDLARTRRLLQQADQERQERAEVRIHHTEKGIA